MRDQDWKRLEETVKPQVSEDDWEDFKSGIEDRTMSIDEYEKWAKEMIGSVTGVVKGAVDATVPAPAKEPVKEGLEYLLYSLGSLWLLGKGGKATMEKVRNGGGQKK